MFVVDNHRVIPQYLTLNTQLNFNKWTLQKVSNTRPATNHVVMKVIQESVYYAIQ